MRRLCPVCKNRGINDVHVRLISGKCDLCDGVGFVDTDFVCECGRPAVVPIANTVVCTRKACQDRALGVKEQKRFHIMDLNGGFGTCGGFGPCGYIGE